MLGTIIGLAAAVAAPAVAQADTNPNAEAEWVTATTETAAFYTASTVATVPTLSCSGVAMGSYEGQTSFVELDNAQSTDSHILADVREYCDGPTAEYSSILSTTDPSDTADTLLTSPAFTVSAGDRVQLTVKTTASSSTATVSDLTTHRHATRTVPEPVVNGWSYIGAAGVTADSSGAPVTGVIPAGDDDIVTGPLSTTTGQAFNATKFGAANLGALCAKGKLDSFDWETSDGSTVLAEPTPPNHGFSITYTGTDSSSSMTAARSLAAPARPIDG
jgi:hypothetical protein